MYFYNRMVVSLALVLSLTSASPLEDIFGRAVGDSCRAPQGTGVCKSTSSCKGISYPQPLCPRDPDDIQCCVDIPCKADGGSGYCRSKRNNGCSGGKFHPGSGPPWPCPGDDDIQCCIKSSTPPPPPPPPPSGSVGAKVLAKAKTAAGTPYAWGGGSCSGPSGDQPPYDYGEVGYDCSGLVCWALCKVTGRDLFKEGLRNTRTMYCAAESTLKYKKVPFAQRKPGDAVFFGGSCACTGSSIHHVGLVSENIAKMWNAPNDDINRVLESTISGFGESPCPNVIRFT
ncbi:MAG: hypothetical protein M1825_006024 [Sarcosagium campestre]|nr:MAG: hypothetical protein M1825_006024 [Sarcosagium campestre]